MGGLLEAMHAHPSITTPTFPMCYDARARDEFYQKLSLRGINPGSGGVDSVLIAYDGLLACRGSWEQLCMCSVLHRGDNDSTGCIAGALFGAYYGLDPVPKLNYAQIEYFGRARALGAGLWQCAAGLTAAL